MNIAIKRNEFGVRCVERGGVLIATICDHRRRNKKDKCSGIQDNWGVAWSTGRYDWHGTYQEARDNALKGN